MIKIFKCPKCGNTSASYHYGRKRIECNTCGTRLNSFKEE
jgi:ribosomal protein S27E